MGCNSLTAVLAVSGRDYVIPRRAYCPSMRRVGPDGAAQLDLRLSRTREPLPLSAVKIEPPAVARHWPAGRPRPTANDHAWAGSTGYDVVSHPGGRTGCAGTAPRESAGPWHSSSWATEIADSRGPYLTALLDYAVQGVHGLPQGGVGVGEVNQKHVDVVGSEDSSPGDWSTQGQALRPGRLAVPGPFGITRSSTGGHQNNVFAARAQGFTQHALGIAEHFEVGVHAV